MMVGTQSPIALARTIVANFFFPFQMKRNYKVLSIQLLQVPRKSMLHNACGVSYSMLMTPDEL